jgi:hypothetical protein
LLFVPYVSQVGPHADKYTWDCGPANVSMMVEHYTNLQMYPDELMSIIGEDRYTFAGELQYMMGIFGLQTDVPRFKNIDEVIDRAPVILLVYHHWILVTGGDETVITYHDTLIGPNIEEHRGRQRLD